MGQQETGTMQRMLRKLIRDEQGTVLVEYALIGTLIAMVIMIGLEVLGSSWVDLMGGVGDKIGSANDGGS